MTNEQPFWSRDRRAALLWTSVLGSPGGMLGNWIVDRHFLLGALLRGAGLGFAFGLSVAIFAFVFPKAQDDPPRWKRWGAASFFLGLLVGAAVALMIKEGLRLDRPDS